MHHLHDCDCVLHSLKLLHDCDYLVRQLKYRDGVTLKSVVEADSNDEEFVFTVAGLDVF